MKHVSIMGQSARRFAARALPAAAFALVLVSPAAAQPLAQAGGLEPTAPENLRCPGRPGPKDGFHFEAEWQNVATYSGQCSRSPWITAAISLSSNKDSNQIFKYNADGQQVAVWTMAAREAYTDGISAVAVAPDGTLYVADAPMGVVRKLSPSGQELGTWKSCDCPGKSGWMVTPVSVAVDGTATTYMSWTGRLTR